MSGKKGQIQRKQRTDTGRQRLWQSMRIMRRFTIPDLMRTSDEQLDNTRKYVVNLTRHGFLRDCGGYVRGEKGAFNVWAIAINPGPDHPLVCLACGQPITAKECKTAVTPPHPCPRGRFGGDDR